MAEIFLYALPGQPPALTRAIEEINRDVGQGDSKYDEAKSQVKALCNRPRRLNFATADVTELITTGLGGLNDELAAGVSILIFFSVSSFLATLQSSKNPSSASCRSVEGLKRSHPCANLESLNDPSLQPKMATSPGPSDGTGTQSKANMSTS